MKNREEIIKGIKDIILLNGSNMLSFNHQYGGVDPFITREARLIGDDVYFVSNKCGMYPASVVNMSYLTSLWYFIWINFSK